MGLESTSAIQDRFGVPNNLDSLLLFHEDNYRPAARLSMADLPFSTMTDVIDANKYLQLPRLSSQVLIAYIYYHNTKNVYSYNILP